MSFSKCGSRYNQTLIMVCLFVRKYSSQTSDMVSVSTQTARNHHQQHLLRWTLFPPIKPMLAAHSGRPTFSHRQQNAAMKRRK